MSDRPQCPATLRLARSDSVNCDLGLNHAGYHSAKTLIGRMTWSNPEVIEATPSVDPTAPTGEPSTRLAEVRRLMWELESAAGNEAFARADGDSPDSEVLKAMKVTDTARTALDAARRAIRSFCSQRGASAALRSPSGDGRSVSAA